MEIPGPCDICEAHTTLKSCSLCGRKVCPEHWVEGAHSCTICARDQGGPPRSLEKEPGQIPRRPEGDIPEEGTGRYT